MPRFYLIHIALVLLVIAGTYLGFAGRAERALRPFIGKTMRLEIWGVAQGTFEVESIFAIGAGLHFYLRQGGKRTHLKVAQPQSIRADDTRIDIAIARYVQLRRKKLKPAMGTQPEAVSLVVNL